MSDLLEIRQEGCVAVLTLNDPDRRNVLSSRLCQALSAAIADVEQDGSVKAVVITANGKSFCSGADLDDLIAASKGEMKNVEAVYKSFMDVAECSLPVIAAVNGGAIGAGLNLALAADVRIASDVAYFESRFLQIGLHPGGGHCWLLGRTVPWPELVRMTLLGRKVGADEACRIGLAQEAVPAGSLLESALEAANAVAKYPRDLLVSTKASMALASASSYAQSEEHERGQQALSLQKEAFAELVSAMRGTVKGHRS